MSVLLPASASPARRRLLEQAAIPYHVQVSGVDEDAITHADPAQLLQPLAGGPRLIQSADTSSRLWWPPTSVITKLRWPCRRQGLPWPSSISRPLVVGVLPGAGRNVNQGAS